MRGVVYVGGPSTATHCKSGAPQYMTGQPQPHGALEWVKNDNTMYIGGHFICNEVHCVGLPPFVPPCIDISSERTQRPNASAAPRIIAFHIPVWFHWKFRTYKW